MSSCTVIPVWPESHANIGLLDRRWRLWVTGGRLCGCGGGPDMIIVSSDTDGADDDPASECERLVQVLRVTGTELRKAAELLRVTWRREPPTPPPSDPGYPGFYPLD
jgi:hypothetical protein